MLISPSPSKTVDDKLRSHLTFKLQLPKSWNSFDLASNKVSRSVAENEPEPKYIKALREKPSRKRLLGEAEALQLKPYLTQSNAVLTNYFESASTNIGASNVLQKVTDSEVAHYNSILRQSILQNRNYLKGHKEEHLHPLLCSLGEHGLRADVDAMEGLML
jgi:hypothetical protein